MENTTKRWVAITCDGNAKWRFFYKWIDESESVQLENFQREVENWGVDLITMYREDDIVEHCQL